MKKIALTVLFIITIKIALCQTSPEVIELVPKMTIEEKGKMVVGHNYNDTVKANTSIFDKKLSGTI